MKKKDFLPIILGSDENAYGTARLFREAYPEVTPLLGAHPSRWRCWVLRPWIQTT